MLPKSAASILRVKLPVCGNNRNPERKARSRDHADCRIGADPAAVADGVNQKAGEQCPDSRADEKVQVQDIAQHGAAEDGMGKPMADVTHAP